MYSEWDSVENEVVDLSKCKSVLHNYPPNVGRDVAKTVVSSLLAVNNAPETRIVQSDILYGEGTKVATKADVDWCMEVVCFGLSLTLSEVDTLKNCVGIYLDWLDVLNNGSGKKIPTPIQQNPQHYIRQMLLHLQNLFIPRSDGEVTEQISLCYKVLAAVQSVSCENLTLNRLTWESVLKFLLNICNTLLGPPSNPGALGFLMCEELMKTLMKVWLSACSYCFPTPPLWKTAGVMFSGWRHHLHVVDYWCRATAALTSRVTAILYGDNYPKLTINDNDLCFTMKNSSDELVLQTWYRFMNLISNPVDLSMPSEIAATPRFYESVLHNEGLLDPAYHPCLGNLPQIFLRAIKGISTYVDAFLGMSQEKHYEISHTPVLNKISNPETPTNLRKSARPPNKKSTSSMHSKGGSSSSIAPAQKVNTSPDMSPKLISGRPLCNSVLNLFGQWLFDAALAGCSLDADKSAGAQMSRSRSSSAAFTAVNPQMEIPNLATNYMFDGMDVDSFDAGRSEACAILCRIFTSKKSGEHILPTYLSRFYIVLSHGLLNSSQQVLASIILNSFDLFRMDLQGVTCLIPSTLSALESILPDRELYQFQQFVNIVEFRRASLHILLSMLPLTLHFDDLIVSDIQSLMIDENSNKKETSFRSLRLRMIKLLVGALQCESDSTNIQMILGGFLLALQDSSLFECATSDKAEEDDSGEDPMPDTAYGMFVHCIHLVSQRLSVWKSDLNVTVAALQLLCGMAQVKVLHAHDKEYMQAVHELCKYIVQQCERPKPHHKRELHSMIVASFSTLTTWLLEHPHLLKDKTCLQEVLEIIELGISGSKSSSYDGSTVAVTKGEKDLNPVSMRVLEAAEYALHCIFEHIGAFPSPCGPKSLCSLLDERDFSSSNDWSVAVSKFQYFIVHRSILLGILEDKKLDKEKIPTVTMVSRSATGRKVWDWKFKQTPNVDKLSLEQYLNIPSRPEGSSDVGNHPHVCHRTFPEDADSIPLVKADCSIPLLSEVPNEEQTKDMETLKDVIEKQEKYDNDITRKLKNESVSQKECLPAPSVDEFHSARLLLSHLNLMTLSSVQHSNQRHGPDLVLLNKQHSNFCQDLMALDSIPTRNNDTVYVFYAKHGQSTKDQILANASGSASELQQGFIELLLSLGWPVSVDKHPGWTGDVNTSYKLTQNQQLNNEVIDMSTTGVNIFDGSRFALYYSDISTETVFLVPGVSKQDLKKAQNSSTESIEKLEANEAKSTTSRGTNNARQKNSGNRGSSQSSDVSIAIVWIESYDDIDKFPLQEVLGSSSNTNDCIGIFIHPMENGLFRVWLHGQASAKGGLAVPVVSGAVVSRRSLGLAIRMTAVNICHRRRLDNDSYSQPQVRRKHKITELLTNYHRRCTEPDFYTAVFTES